ncbi:hypothetical protein G7Y89_g11488 [Cudoniella acicularis]|uniref:Rhamnogalacturonase A/B/Epimerase-like pectate lyase domain-containing protein n=1 Tax=Cudoniella acicularis TaxID=354080 RepID=A0A8H4VY89_9HELO|nr:hypothetical protein G7Y89_g11488 [Cudoniella acicularis]
MPPLSLYLRQRPSVFGLPIKRIYILSLFGSFLLALTIVIPVTIVLAIRAHQTSPTGTFSSSSLLGKRASTLTPTRADTTNVDWTTLTTPKGDHLPDFSFAGYHASETSLPQNTTVAVTLSPSSGDQTSAIQAALTAAGSATEGRVVLLSPGTYSISPGLIIPSNVVLRGSGAGSTHLTLSKLEGKTVFSLGKEPEGVKPTTVKKIVDGYVGIGVDTVEVDGTDGLSVGQNVFVNREVTKEWVDTNGMGDLVRDGKHETWLPVGRTVSQPRKIKAISKNTITLNIPLTDSLDAKYMSPELVAYDPPKTSTEIGIENLSITLSPTCSGANLNSDTDCNAPAISFEPWTQDSWARDLEMKGFNNFVTAQYNSSQITIQNVAMLRDADTNGEALPEDILITGSQILVQDCQEAGLASAKSFAVVTGSLAPGPNAILRHKTPSKLQTLFPHQRWAHGILFEDTSAYVELINRGILGTGHGWTMNAGVGWNLRGGAFVQSPPLGINWCVGCEGTIDGSSNGTFVDEGKQVVPTSLFGTQLQARMGKKA